MSPHKWYISLDSLSQTSHLPQTPVDTSAVIIKVWYHFLGVMAKVPSICRDKALDISFKVWSVAFTSIRLPSTKVSCFTIFSPSLSSKNWCSKEKSVECGSFGSFGMNCQRCPTQRG